MPALQPEAPRLVRARRDHAGADDHRPAAQPRIALLLDRREERVDVDVEDLAPIGLTDPSLIGLRSRLVLRHAGLVGTDPP